MRGARRHWLRAAPPRARPRLSWLALRARCDAAAPLNFIRSFSEHLREEVRRDLHKRRPAVLPSPRTDTNMAPMERGNVSRLPGCPKRRAHP
jgi:hypothetical protein